MSLWLSVVVAMAQDPVASEPDDVDTAYEVVVWGEAAVRHARYDVVRALEAAGWEKGRELEGRIRFRPPAPWMGKATLTYDGDLVFRRPVLAVRVQPLDEPRMPPPDHVVGAPTPPDASYIGGTNAVQGHDSGTVWVLPGWRVVQPAHERAQAAIAGELAAYRQVVEETRRRESEPSG